MVITAPRVAFTRAEGLSLVESGKQAWIKAGDDIYGENSPHSACRILEQGLKKMTPQDALICAQDWISFLAARLKPSSAGGQSALYNNMLVREISVAMKLLSPQARLTVARKATRDLFIAGDLLYGLLDCKAGGQNGVACRFNVLKAFFTGIPNKEILSILGGIDEVMSSGHQEKHEVFLAAIFPLFAGWDTLNFTRQQLFNNGFAVLTQKGEYPVPTLFSLRGSLHHLASSVCGRIGLPKPDEYNETECHFDYNRFLENCVEATRLKTAYYEMRWPNEPCNRP